MQTGVTMALTKTIRVNVIMRVVNIMTVVPIMERSVQAQVIIEF